MSRPGQPTVAVSLTSPTQLSSRASGFSLGVGAYLLWGFLPLYLRALAPAGPVEVIAHRIVWTLAVCGLLVLAGRRQREIINLVRQRRSLTVLASSGALLTVNWLVFVYAVTSNQLAEAALGYFINPLVTVALAVVCLGERLHRRQWLALAVASAAVVVITVEIGHLPWIALVLAVSFGFYGLAEKQVGRTVTAPVAMTVETLAMTPLAIAYLIWLASHGQQHFSGWGIAQTWLMIGVGLVTAVPLLLFNGAARRLPLSKLGLLQFMCPVMQFLTALLVFGEEITAARWAGFALVWLALVILVIDGLISHRRPIKQATN